MIAVAPLPDTRRKVRGSVSLEADREYAPWRGCDSRLKEIGGTLRQQLRLACAWAGNDRTIVCR
jgi:hypothetical protein